MDGFLSSDVEPMDEIEFDPLYIDIDFSLAKLDASNDPLGDITAIETINWGEIKDNCLNLLKKKFNLRVELWLLRASLHVVGSSALYESLVKIDQFLTELSLSAPDEADNPLYSGAYAAALSWLSTLQCLSLYKNSKLSPEQSISLEVIYPRDQDNESHNLHFSQIISAISQANIWYQSAQLPPLFEQLTLMSSALKNIENLVNQGSRGYQLNCYQLTQWLKDISGFIKSLTEKGDEEESIPGGVTTSFDPVLPDGKFKNRQDVTLMLDMILDYFEKFEPSHPAPILIRRSQKMIGMDFAEIIEDMLPDALATLQQFTGK